MHHLISHRTTSADGFPWLTPVCGLRVEILLSGNRGVCLGVGGVHGSRISSPRGFLGLLYSGLRSHWLRICGFMKRLTVVRRSFNSSLWVTGLAQNDRSHCPSLGRHLLSALCVRDHSTQRNKNNNQKVFSFLENRK